MLRGADFFEKSKTLSDLRTSWLRHAMKNKNLPLSSFSTKLFGVFPKQKINHNYNTDRSSIADFRKMFYAGLLLSLFAFAGAKNLRKLENIEVSDYSVC